MPDRLTPLLTAAMHRITGASARVTGLTQLSGGANMESWSFDCDLRGCILRRAPTLEMMTERPFGHAVEAAVIRAAHHAGVRAPRIVGELVPSDDLGSGYVMCRIEAEVNPARILKMVPPKLLADLAQELAKIHAVPLPDLPKELPCTTPDTLLAGLHARFTAAGGDRPVMALALRWLQDHMPSPATPVFLHGDFRLGNVMANPRGLAAVLDWELAHIGDRHQDLAYGCINSWRFGQIDNPAFGLGDLATYWSAYENASGTKVDPVRFRFWLVYACIWWGLTCLHMAHIWRAGQDQSLERAVIGRRVSETEVDLLMLLEEDAPLCEREAVLFVPPAAQHVAGEPSARELLEALQGWANLQVKPRMQGRDKFMAAVAVNALGMLAREAARPVCAEDAALSQALLSGVYTLATPGLLAKLKQSALAKLTIDQPKYSALVKARTLWCQA